MELNNISVVQSMSNGSSIDQLQTKEFFNDQVRIKQLSNDGLLAGLEEQFALERRTSHHILLHLKEVRLRRLYAERGFPNLFSMLVQYFHQSESAANQRLKALDLMMDVPVVEERLISGDLSLSTVAMAQRQIKREEKLTGKKVSKEKKAEIVESITNKTMAQAESELFKHLPETASNPQNFERRISEDTTRMSLNFSNEDIDMMNRLKELWAHVDPTMDPVVVIRRSLEMTLQKIDPLRTKAKSKCKGKAETKAIEKPEGIETVEAITMGSDVESVGVEVVDQSTQSLTESVKHRSTNHPISRVKRLTYYKKEIDRQLWKRAGSRCEFVDRKTGRRCPCRFGLQREHVIPLALGGTNGLSNLQLLCFTHNQLRARQAFGNKKIDSYQSLTRKLFKRQ